MKLLNKLLFYISVPRCVGCGERIEVNDIALCSACKIEYEDSKLRNCPRCAKLLPWCDCTNKHLDAHFIHRLIKVFRYSPRGRGQSNELIFSLKRDNRSDVLELLSRELSEAIRNNVDEPQNYVFTSVPRRRKAIVKYGIDHAELLASAVAKRLGAKYIKILKSNVKSEQKKSNDSEARIKNADFSLRKGAPDLTHRKVILIDDIVTTGASMGRCAMVLKSAGADKIIGATLAIAYKE